MNAAQKLGHGSRRSYVRLYGLVAICALVIYLVGLGGYPLADPDEPVYGQVAKEMALGSGWLTPHYDGKVWFDKPPLFYWLSGICARVIGPNSETASRLPSAVLAAGLVILTMMLVSSELGRRARVFSAIAIGTCIQQIVLAHAAVTDMTFVFFLTAALLAYRRWTTSQKPLWAITTGVMTGLATLAKGPVAPVLLFSAFFVDSWLSGKLRRLFSMDTLIAVATFLVVALPWYLSMYHLHGDLFVQGFLVANNITRFLKPEHAAQTGNWLSYFRNLPVLAIFFFPWSGFLPSAIKHAWGKHDSLRLCIVWAAVVFVFFSVSKTQLVTYIFPLYPAAAVLVGYLWSSAASGDMSALHGVRIGVWFNAIVGVLLAVALVVISRQRIPNVESACTAVSATLILTAVASVLWVQTHPQESAAGAIWIVGGGMVVFMLVLMLAVAPRIASYTSTRDIVRRIPHDAEVAQFGSHYQSLLFYLGKTPRELTTTAQAEAFLNQARPAYLICRKKKTPHAVTRDAIVEFDDGERVLLTKRKE